MPTTPLVPAAYTTRHGHVRWMVIPDQSVIARDTFRVTGLRSLDAALAAIHQIKTDAFGDIAPSGAWRQ